MAVTGVTGFAVAKSKDMDMLSGPEPDKSSDAAVDTAMAISSVLRSLSSAARAGLRASAAPVTVGKGAFVCRAGEPGDSVYVVVAGEVEIRSTSTEGQEVLFARFGLGSVIGEIAVLDGGPRSADVVCVRPSRLLRIPRAALLAAFHSEPAGAIALVVELAKRLRATNSELQSTRTLDLGGRLAAFLLAATSNDRPLALTQTEIARRLGVSRERVNRKLNDWRALGWVALDPSGVRLLRRGSLRETFGGDPYLGAPL